MVPKTDGQFKSVVHSLCNETRLEANVELLTAIFPLGRFINDVLTNGIVLQFLGAAAPIGVISLARLRCGRLTDRLALLQSR